MPTIRAFAPAAARSRCAICVTFSCSLATAAPTQAIGSAARAHAVTSLPPIETVISFTRPRWSRRNRSAASICVVPA
jgi:hypothetical protein